MVNEDTAAILLEPVQGESGVHPASLAYLKAARALCDRFGALLIFDEVQTGVGRTGKMWAYQNYGVVPDVMTLAKGLGGGVPIGACLARGAAAETLKPGDHGSTFAGNPLATAAANAVLDILADERLTENAAVVGRHLCELLKPLGAPRGMGLMIGLELEAPIAKAVVREALNLGLVINATGDTTLRLLPPLILTKEQATDGANLLREAILKAKS
jgi:acetylornithine/N-succinyldiaminopimelate aminotransferase